MNYLSQAINVRMKDTSKSQELVEYVITALIGIAIPLVLSHPQPLVGSIVNLVLVLAAVNVRGWSKLTSLIVLPSISALMNGMLFGGFTIFLVYLLPFIWIGNAALVLIFKRMYVSDKTNYVLTLPVAAVLKTIIILGSALVLVKLSIIPLPFAFLMGKAQILTALIGGGIAYPIIFAYNKFAK